MGNPTDELRAKLSEHGIEYEVVDRDVEQNTFWNLNGVRYKYNALVDSQHGCLSICCANFLTPEQAIAATVGAGTCHFNPDDVGFTWWDKNDVEHYEEYSASDECGSASCDKCGYSMMVGEEGWFDGWDEITEWTEEDGSEHKGYVLKPRFKHCPRCGRLVTE